MYVFDITDFKKLNSENQWGLVSKASNYILSLESKDSGTHEDFTQVQVQLALTNRNLLVWKWLLYALKFIYHTLLTMGFRHFVTHLRTKLLYDIQNICVLNIKCTTSSMIHFWFFILFWELDIFTDTPLIFLLYGQCGKDILQKSHSCVS